MTVNDYNIKDGSALHLVKRRKPAQDTTQNDEPQNLNNNNNNNGRRTAATIINVESGNNVNVNDILGRVLSSLGGNNNNNAPNNNNGNNSNINAAGVVNLRSMLNPTDDLQSASEDEIDTGINLEPEIQQENENGGYSPVSLLPPVLRSCHAINLELNRLQRNYTNTINGIAPAEQKQDNDTSATNNNSVNSNNNNNRPTSMQQNVQQMIQRVMNGNSNANIQVSTGNNIANVIHTNTANNHTTSNANGNTSNVNNTSVNGTNNDNNSNNNNNGNTSQRRRRREYLSDLNRTWKRAKIMEKGGNDDLNNNDNIKPSKMEVDTNDNNNNNNSESKENIDIGIMKYIENVFVELNELQNEIETSDKPIKYIEQKRKELQKKAKNAGHLLVQLGTVYASVGHMLDKINLITKNKSTNNNNNDSNNESNNDNNSASTNNERKEDLTEEERRKRNRIRLPQLSRSMHVIRTAVPVEMTVLSAHTLQGSPNISRLQNLMANSRNNINVRTTPVTTNNGNTTNNTRNNNNNNNNNNTNSNNASPRISTATMTGDRDEKKQDIIDPDDLLSNALNELDRKDNNNNNNSSNNNNSNGNRVTNRNRNRPTPNRPNNMGGMGGLFNSLMQMMGNNNSNNNSSNNSNTSNGSTADPNDDIKKQPIKLMYKLLKFILLNVCLNDIGAIKNGNTDVILKFRKSLKQFILVEMLKNNDTPMNRDEVSNLLAVGFATYITNEKFTKIKHANNKKILKSIYNLTFNHFKNYALPIFNVILDSKDDNEFKEKILVLIKDSFSEWFYKLSLNFTDNINGVKKLFINVLINSIKTMANTGLNFNQLKTYAPQFVSHFVDAGKIYYLNKQKQKYNNNNNNNNNNINIKNISKKEKEWISHINENDREYWLNTIRCDSKRINNEINKMNKHQFSEAYLPPKSQFQEFISNNDDNNNNNNDNNNDNESKND